MQCKEASSCAEDGPRDSILDHPACSYRLSEQHSMACLCSHSTQHTQHSIAHHGIHHQQHRRPRQHPRRAARPQGLAPLARGSPGRTGAICLTGSCNCSLAAQQACVSQVWQWSRSAHRHWQTRQQRRSLCGQRPVVACAIRISTRRRQRRCVAHAAVWISEQPAAFWTECTAAAATAVWKYALLVPRRQPQDVHQQRLEHQAGLYQLGEKHPSPEGERLEQRVGQADLYFEGCIDECVHCFSSMTIPYTYL